MSLIRLALHPERMEQATPLEEGADVALACWQARVGEILTVISPHGRYFRARLLPGEREVRPFEALPHGVEPPAGRRLCQALPEKERMLWIIQKAVELGATEIQPVLPVAEAAAHHQPRQDKSATWEKVALEAARQCRRAIVPPVRPALCLTEVLTLAHGGALLFLDVGEGRDALARVAEPLAGSDLSLLVGHEGGWREEERQAAKQAGALRVHLGARILRTETAGMAALAMVCGMETRYEGGDLS